MFVRLCVHQTARELFSPRFCFRLVLGFTKFQELVEFLLSSNVEGI